jgi:aminoglycoside/choline kinase family phosphotransferase
MTDRTLKLQDFLQSAGWGSAQRQFLAGDASDRSYDRLTRGSETAVLMDAPPGKGDDPATFVAVAGFLNGLGLSAPKVIAQDLQAGFLLLEDLGDALFARVVAADPTSEGQLYQAATDVLIHLQSHPRPAGMTDLSAAEWAAAAAFALDWYRFSVTGDRVDPVPFRAAVTEALQRHADGPRVTILRDFHAENLLWLPQRSGLARVGLLDFQLAQAGQPGYDLVSLLQDARRDVEPQTEEAMIEYFATRTARPADAFRRSYALLGAQRALRILGVFARLCLVPGKPGYLPLIPRVWSQLQRNLAQPGLERVAEVCACLPAPTPLVLQRIEAQCGAFR